MMSNLSWLSKWYVGQICKTTDNPINISILAGENTTWNIKIDSNLFMEKLKSEL